MMSVSEASNQILSCGVIACADANMLPAACCALLSVHANLSTARPRLFIMAIDATEKQTADIELFARLHSLPLEILHGRTPEVERESFGRWSMATLARLYMDALVPPGIDRLLYVDADTLAVSPVDELFQMDMAAKPLAAVDDYLMAFPDKIGRRQAKLGLRPASRYFNAGILLFDWRKCLEQGTLKLAKDTFEARPEFFDAHDQDVLNIAFEDNWLALDPRWNTQTGIVPFVERPAIVHFTGRKKPWQAVVPWPHRRMQAYYAQALAGTPWASFSRKSSLRDRIGGAGAYFFAQLAARPKISRAGKYFRRNG